MSERWLMRMIGAVRAWVKQSIAWLSKRVAVEQEGHG